MNFDENCKKQFTVLRASYWLASNHCRFQSTPSLLNKRMQVYCLIFSVNQGSAYDRSLASNRSRKASPPRNLFARFVSRWLLVFYCSIIFFWQYNRSPNLHGASDVSFVVYLRNGKHWTWASFLTKHTTENWLYRVFIQLVKLEAKRQTFKRTFTADGAFPQSHCSPVSTIPFPQTGVGSNGTPLKSFKQ